jgi:hypothetical protein
MKRANPMNRMKNNSSHSRPQADIFAVTIWYGTQSEESGRIEPVHVEAARDDERRVICGRTSVVGEAMSLNANNYCR